MNVINVGNVENECENVVNVVNGRSKFRAAKPGK
jgi:hypothetical protein